MSSLYEILKNRFYRICAEKDLLDQQIRIQARALTAREAIGNPEGDDFPLQKGKERLMEAVFETSRGQAFTDQFGDFSSRLDEILAMPLENNFRRAVFVASMNAVLRHLGLAENTVHCRDNAPAQCAGQLADFIIEHYGRPRIVQIGYQPKMVERLQQDFDYRIVDLDPDNIGQIKGGVAVEGPNDSAGACQWADLLLVTGTTIVNDTIEAFLTPKPVLFYGTTIAGAAGLMGWPRFCACSQ
ncbi:MAG: DUF364 domain-containing protein [Desulfosalsimonas sp.]|uniref:Rossmann-like domain-containing protein n=1 Tax=Desulfosalsimonas sp. TaxID=3073848 RepID=UPI003970E6BB